ncbi:Putative G-patch domain-containing protein [Septoria linicola]|uniref:G-patch domain-containing protein n=1 Tax=Septoria linicola TaxID=215465 RepID=A0A9Q9EP93_9PEZI|nr:Putative G-patch domain-containing protein [Septoria linicola]
MMHSIRSSPSPTLSSDSEADKVVFKGRTVPEQPSSRSTNEPPEEPAGTTVCKNARLNVRMTQQPARNTTSHGITPIDPASTTLVHSPPHRTTTSISPPPSIQALPNSAPSAPISWHKDQPAYHSDHWVSKWSVQLEPAGTPFVPDPRLSKTEKRRRLNAGDDEKKVEWEDLERKFGSGKNEGARDWEELERRENGRYKFGRKVLEKQGWKKGEGLGRDGEGRKEVVDVKGKDGREDRGGLGS